MKRHGTSYWRFRRNKLLKKHVFPEGRVLDIGSGWRVFYEEAVRLDIDPAVSPNVLADIQKGSGFKAECFDTVLMFDILEHLEHPHQALKEVKRILKSGGMLYLTVPFCYPRHGVEYYRFSDLALKKMLQDLDSTIIPISKSKLWNIVWNYHRENTLVEGYFVMARKI